MDFLVSHDGSIRIKKHILKTSKGRLKLHKQASNACARIIIADSTTIPANTETLLHCKVDKPFIRKEQTCPVEPANYLTSKGCFVARTLVDPDCDDVVMSVVNLSDQTVKLNQNSVLGKLEDVESIYSGQSHSSKNLSSSKELPKHLHILTENASPKLSVDEKQKL